MLCHICETNEADYTTDIYTDVDTIESCSFCWDCLCSDDELWELVGGVGDAPLEVLRGKRKE